MLNENTKRIICKYYIIFFLNTNYCMITQDKMNIEDTAIRIIIGMVV
jgi:hypothetical protein